MSNFKPIILVDVGDIKPVVLGKEQEALLQSYLTIEKESLFVDALEEWSKTGSKARKQKCKELLAEHRKLLQDAIKVIQ